MKNNDVIPNTYLQQIQIRFKELKDYNYDWKSFYTGAVEGYLLAYGLGLIADKKEIADTLRANCAYEYQRGLNEKHNK